MGIGGWGQVVAFVTDLFGSKAERRRNKIERLKREYDKLNNLPYSDKRSARLQCIANELRNLYREAENA